MGRKRTVPTPRPPPHASSGEEEEDQEQQKEEEVVKSPRAAAAQMRPQNPQTPPHPSAAAAADDAEEGSDDADLQAFQMRPVSHSPAAKTRSVSHSPAKPSAAAPQVESDEEEDGGSDPVIPVPVPVPNKPVTRKSRTLKDKKRPAPEPAPSGRGKKAKAEAAPAAKGKKKKPDASETEKPGPEPTPSAKAKKNRAWSSEDSIRILEALAAHVKNHSALPKTDVLLGAVRDSLDRKDINYTHLYEKVRRLKEAYEKTVTTGVLPSGEDELHLFNLSETVWGQKAKEALAAASASQVDSTVIKTKKAQDSKEKVDGNAKAGTVIEVPNQKKSNKGLDVETDTTVRRKRLAETAPTAAEDGDALTKNKGKKTDKEASTGNHNAGTVTEEETHEGDSGTGVQGTYRSFDELQNLYPGLAACVEGIKAHHRCGQTLGRVFGFISDEKASALESKIKAIGITAAKLQIREGDIKKKLLKMVIALRD